MDFNIENDRFTSGVKSSPEIYLRKSIVTEGGNYLKYRVESRRCKK